MTNEEYLKCREDVTYFAEWYFGGDPDELVRLRDIQNQRFSELLSGEYDEIRTLARFVVWQMVCHNEQTIVVVADNYALRKKIREEVNQLLVTLTKLSYSWASVQKSVSNCLCTTNGSKLITVCLSDSNTCRGLTVDTIVLVRPNHNSKWTRFNEYTVPAVVGRESSRIIRIV